MNNCPKDASGGAGYRGRADSSLTGVSISIESDDNESTTAEHDYLLSPASASSAVTSGTTPGQSSASTTINLEPGRSNSLSGVGRLSHHGNLLSSFLARQRSYSPATSTPMRATTQVNRRLQQSRSMVGNNSSLEEPSPSGAPVGGAGGVATAAVATVGSSSPAGVRQLGFWRVNLNEVFSLSTAPSTEALRSFITHSNFRYQPAAAAGPSTPPGDQQQSIVAGPEVPSSPLRSRVGASACQGHMSRSISLREGEMRHNHGLNGSRHNASVIGLASNNLPAYAENLPVNNPNPEHDDSDNSAASGAAAAAGNPPPDPHEHNVDEEHLISDMVVQILSHFVRYLPIICILLIKFIHDHLLGILDLLVLQTVMYNVNRSVRHQVARLAQKNYVLLVRDACIVLMVVTMRLFMATTPPDPLGLIVPPPKRYFTVEVTALPFKPPEEDAVRSSDSITYGQLTAHPTSGASETLKADTYEALKVIPLGMLLYYVAVSDLIIKLLTMLVKLVITMLPMHVIRLKVRARLYVLVEYLSQFYRALTPITQWFLFLYESYSGLEIISGGLFSSLYLGAKIFELLERGKSLKKAIVTFRRNIDSERPPTKDELDAAGSVCPICHDSYNTPIILECGHIFCDECVQTWFKREQTCPMCRAKVSDDPAWQDGSTTFFHQLY